MRDRKIAMRVDTAAPQNDVAIDNARAPAAALSSAPQRALYRLQGTQHFERRQAAFQSNGCIGIAALRWPYRRAVDYGRAGQHLAQGSVDFVDRRAHHLSRRAEARVGLVRPEREKEELAGQMSSQIRP